MYAKISVLGLYYDNPGLFDGFSVPDGMDRETAIEQILQDCAELEILFPDAAYMQDAIRRWSAISQRAWKKLYYTVTVEYDPIANYDRTETRDLTTTGTAASTRTVAAFNSSTQEPQSGADSNVNNRDTGTIHTKGNIGVTTTQQMLQAERESALYNVYDAISQDFQRRFCLLVY